MDEIKKQHFIDLIKNAHVFDEKERGEWLQLLPLMNDKQLLELERILISNEPKKAEPYMANFGGQGMSHIANLPHLSMGKPDVATPKKEERKADFKEVLKQRVEELELPSATETKVLPEKKEITKPMEPPKVVAPQVTPPPPAQVQAPLSNLTNRPVPKHDFVPIPRPANSSTVVAQKIQKGTPMVVPGSEHLGPMRQPQTVVHPPGVAGAGSGPVALNSVSDISLLTPAQFRIMENGELISKMTNLVRQGDYFQVKFALEQSPLYKTYLNLGKMMLDGKLDFHSAQTQLQNSGKEYLSQLEFERFTDVLAALEVN